MNDLFPEDAHAGLDVKVAAARTEAAALITQIGRGGREWESGSGKAVTRIKRWRREAEGMPEPQRLALLACAAELAGHLTMWFRRHVE